MAILGGRSKVLAGSGGLVNKSIALRKLFLAGLLDQHVGHPTAQELRIQPVDATH